MTTGNRRSAPSSAAAKEVSTNGTPHSPWPAILEKLPDYEPDTLVLSLEFYRESVLRRVVDDHGHVTVSLVDIGEVARGLSAGVSLSSGILPGDEADPMPSSGQGAAARPDSESGSAHASGG
jgi:hypothetical protein